MQIAVGLKLLVAECNTDVALVGRVSHRVRCQALVACGLPYTRNDVGLHNAWCLCCGRYGEVARSAALRVEFTRKYVVLRVRKVVQRVAKCVVAVLLEWVRVAM